jgi:hypothetical protein
LAREEFFFASSSKFCEKRVFVFGAKKHIRAIAVYQCDQIGRNFDDWAIFFLYKIAQNSPNGDLDFGYFFPF